MTPRTARHVGILVEIAQRHLEQGRIPQARDQLQRAAREVAADVDDPVARDLLVRDLEQVIESLG
ncbi:hypothetical protein E1262_27865 [Jiangella aurantiaca]|uniref:Tetratricopeptide repeat protein n=1 Tax=Jiangella aurantiaca TaxID=2530373 RepID=A0A4R5A0Y2_9ACTN|nr:hypothetical protein [Jiangella aurantiaca]TDD64550.1 hypothetical protein E1262_27865 [Jiangella aurantiaca]